MYPPNASLSCGASIGSHFNPFFVNTKDNYTTECTIYSPLRCESGDLSGKHGVLNIDPPTLERESVTYTDSNLNLFGQESYSSKHQYQLYCSPLSGSCHIMSTNQIAAFCVTI